MNRRSVLIVSPHFPPINAPDAQRVRTGLPFFPEFGWTPTVLAVDPRYVAGLHEPRLLATLPTGTNVRLCGALPTGIARLAGLGSLGPRAWLNMRIAGARLLREERFDLVFFSTTQFLVLTLGAIWKRRTGTPFVIDVQDPWRTDYYDRAGAPRPPGGWKYRFARWQADRLEEASFRPAAGFVSVSELYLSQLRSRYAWFSARTSATIAFGASEADFEVARNDISLAPSFDRSPGLKYLVSVGAAGPIMTTALNFLFSALRGFRAENPAAAERLRICFVGTSYAPAGREPSTVRPLAEALGVGDLVDERPARVGYFESLKTMLAADALLLLGSDDPGYTPSKIADYFLSRRPVLAFVPGRGAAEARLAELGIENRVSTSEPDAAPRARGLLAALLDGSIQRSAGRDEALFADRYTARACTRRLCELFDRAIAPSHAG